MSTSSCGGGSVTWSSVVFQSETVLNFSNTSEEEIFLQTTLAASFKCLSLKLHPSKEPEIYLNYNGMLQNEMCSSVWMMVPIGHTRLMLERRVV